jgi:hypothetical protein
LQEVYAGPVLFYGPAVAHALVSSLFSFRENLVATNAILSAQDYRPESSTALDTRVGKLVADHSITVKATPTQEEFQGQPLVASYAVDSEGVVPATELTLIEHGILKNMLNDRSLTRPDQKANGHSDGPAVINISTDKHFSPAAIKAELIAAAKKEGLEFAIIIRGGAGFGSGMTEIWKVDLETGNEELLRPAQLGEISLKHLRRVGGSTASQAAYTVETEDSRLASFIVPTALLLDNIDLAPLKLPYLKDENVVSSPLSP